MTIHIWWTESSSSIKEGLVGDGRQDTMQIARLANVQEHWLVGPIEVVCTWMYNNNNICHLADAFIQSDLQSCVHTFYVWVVPGIEPTTLALQAPCSTNWATEGPQLWWEKSIWSITKVYLNTLLYTLCWQWQRSNIFCKSSQGFHTLLLVFWPIPPCRSPLEQWCFGAVAGQHGLSTPSKDFLWGWDLETG